LQRLSLKNSEAVRREKVDDEFDPLSQPLEENSESNSLKTENLTLRSTDESRVAAAISDACKKRKTGSIFSVVVELTDAGTLGLGVKILKNNILAISMLKRIYGALGPGELAGVRLGMSRHVYFTGVIDSDGCDAIGDIVVGVNFKPCREGVKSLLVEVKAEYQRGAREVQLQCWRCHQLCADPVPGSLFPRTDDVFVKGYSLFRSRVFSDWERWNFVEIMLE
jgi:hypothetical protein